MPLRNKIVPVASIIGAAPVSAALFEKFGKQPLDVSPSGLAAKWTELNFGTPAPDDPEALLQGLMVPGGLQVHDMMCIKKFKEFDLDLTRFDKYDQYFGEGSHASFTQAGTYGGPANMFEFIQWGLFSQTYPDVDRKPNDNNQGYKSENVQFGTFYHTFGNIQRMHNELMYIGAREKDVPEDQQPTGETDPIEHPECMFQWMNVHRFEGVAATTGYEGAKANFAGFFRMAFWPMENQVGPLDVYYNHDWVELAFHSLMHSNQSVEYICNIMRNRCSAEYKGVQPTYQLNGYDQDYLSGDRPSMTGFERCVDDIQAMPVTHSRGDFTGKSIGCRMLHARFAEQNKKHCAHISFVEQLDVGGNLKCQKAKETDPKSKFSVAQLANFDNFVNKMKESGGLLAPVTADDEAAPYDRSYRLEQIACRKPTIFDTLYGAPQPKVGARGCPVGFNCVRNKVGDFVCSDVRTEDEPTDSCPMWKQELGFC